MNKKIRPRTLRAATALLFVALVAVGLATHSATGTLSSVGIGSLALICPLGALEVLIASHTPVPAALASLACAVLIAFLLGKVFCGWACPVSLTRSLGVKGRRRPASKVADGAASCESCGSRPSSAAPASRHRLRFDSRHGVLVGALATTALFGFPVFCLVCPVGLTFGLIIGLWRLVGFNEPSWLLLVSIVFLVVEVVFMRTWCHKICPLGALMSLFSSLNRTVKPSIDEQKCLRTAQGISCDRCHKACFEQIDLHAQSADITRPLAECTKCAECVEACPQDAIRFSAFLPQSISADDTSSADEEECSVA